MTIQTILYFEEYRLIERLAGISDSFRTVFAAACAERLFPAYITFSSSTGWGDSMKLREILERLWSSLEANIAASSQVQHDLDSCMALIPGEDNYSSVAEHAYAEDAAAALAYALRCRLNGEPQEAAWAARTAYEAVDQFVVRRENLTTNDRRASRVIAHPLIQAELRRQLRDLEELEMAKTKEAHAPIARLSDWAKQDGQRLFSVNE